MVDNRKLKSGDPAPRKGEYKIIGSRGGDTGETVSIEKRRYPPNHTKKSQSFEEI